MSCHGFLVAAAGPGGGGGAGGMGGHRPPIPVALIAQRALHAVANNAQPVALPLHPPPPPPPAASMPPPPLPPLPPAVAQGHLVVQCPVPRGGSPAEAVPKAKDGGGGDPAAQVGSAEILRRQHLAQQRQRTQQKGGKAAAPEVPSGRTILGTARRSKSCPSISISFRPFLNLERLS